MGSFAIPQNQPSRREYERASASRKRTIPDNHERLFTICKFFQPTTFIVNVENVLKVKNFVQKMFALKKKGRLLLSIFW